MTDDPSKTGQSVKKSAVILGKLAFERLREEAAVRAQTQRLAKQKRKLAVQKQLVIRMLNKERKRPHLRVVKSVRRPSF